MPSRIWTPAALSSDAHKLAGICWRLVEAQHRISTLKLVGDSAAEQAVLEELVEETKPPVPPECRDLHYLLSTPFRYATVAPKGTRFRRAGMTEGAFYAAEAPQTAVAEMAFWRLLFFAESPDTPWPSNPAQYTAFAAAYATQRAIDLTSARYKRDRARWMRLFFGSAASSTAARWTTRDCASVFLICTLHRSDSRVAAFASGSRRRPACG